MKPLIAFIAFVFALTLSVRASDDAWLTDYEAAARKASVENKTMLLDFTGSDWCGWCIKLDKEVFSQPEFAAYAKKNLVLVKVDFPRSKPQSAAVKKQNEKLAAKFKIQGYPTVVVLNSQAVQIGELGYQQGGAKSWISELEKVTGK